VGDDVAKIFEEKEDSSKGRDICFGGAGGLWLEVCVAFIDSNEEVLVARTGLDRKATSEVTGSPVRARDSVGDSLRRKHAKVIIIRERGWIKEGLGASDGSQNSISREGGRGGRDRGFGGGGAKSFSYKVHMTTGSGDGNRRVTRNLLPIQTPYIDPPRTYSM